jgi:hypothetical protein
MIARPVDPRKCPRRRAAHGAPDAMRAKLAALSDRVLSKLGVFTINAQSRDHEKYRSGERSRCGEDYFSIAREA